MNTVAQKNLCAEMLAAQIRRHGPIIMSDFMEAAVDAYYARGDVFGTDGDFTTAPEISQVFGELVGLWTAVTWQRLGAPDQFYFIECGPGRGTLMSDALRAAEQVEGFAKAADVRLVERSAALKAVQRKTLGERAVTWHEAIDDVPAGPFILIGNEFLDALPIRQFEKTAKGWSERCVTVESDGTFKLIRRPVPNFPDPTDAARGAIVEISPAVDAFTAQVAVGVAQYNGAALLIDYGHTQSGMGDTLQAVKDHQFADVLAPPGEVDLTAHVDFERVAQVAKANGAAVHGPVEQGAWLTRLGVQLRAARLTADKSVDVAAGIDAGVARLVNADAMGGLFKVIALTAPDAPAPEGFA